ncbi:MAG TPA: hypothetical protein VFS21_34235 [Roseiflexaceae bacterium]|nr:hypothetical protein [Roseiflexaceae bacterium]
MIFPLQGDFLRYQARYRDVHGRNVLFELRPWRAPGVPGMAIDVR